MLDPTTILEYIPKPVAIPIVCMIGGGLAFAGLETRYMTVADFTKSYVLDLKAAIRAERAELKKAQTDRERERIQESIDALIAELCEERPNDSLCEIST